MRSRRVGFGLAAALWVAAPCAAAPAAPTAESPPIAITHVTVLPMTPGGPEVADQTVILRHGRVVALGAASKVKPPADARRIDGSGKWLMPALTDAHVHIPNDGFLRTTPGHIGTVTGLFDTQDVLTPYLVNGVLQVFNLAAVAEAVGQSREVETGQVLGPHIANAAMVDGQPPVWPGQTRVATTPEEGRQAVRDIRVEGYRYVKVYSRLSEGAFDAIVEEANSNGLKVVGHIPNIFRGQTDKAFVPGYGLVAHAEEYAKQSKDLTDEDIARFAEAAKRNGTWLIATLTSSDWIARETASLAPVKALPTLKYLSPAIQAQWLAGNRYQANATPERLARFQGIVAFNNRLVRAFVAAGIPVLAGTDSMVPGVVPGYALHDELELLAKAGLSNRQVLEAATRLPADWLGVAADRGTLDVGKRADLLLLTADPLADVANTRKIAAVIDGGRYLPRSQLASMLRALAKKNAAAVPGLASVLPQGGADDDDGGG
jgi:imidazolonepropionase-like amidohydrolase